VRSYDNFARIDEVARRSRRGDGSRPAFGIDHIVNPDVEAAGAIMRAMKIGAVGTAVEIGDGYAIAELPIAEGSPVAGMRLKELSALEGWSYLVAFVESDGETSLPNGESVLKSGDRVGILVHGGDMSAVLRFTGGSAAPIDRVAIFGADNISALTVAARMEESQSFWYSLLSFGRSKKRSLTVIDRNVARCQSLAEKFPEAKILNGDITDDGLLQSEGVCESDLMVAASGNYERNLMTAAYMKLKGVAKVIALTSDSAFDEIAEKLGVDVTVPMRDTVIDAIMSHLRGRNVKAVHSVGTREFEIVSCEVAADSAAAGRCIRDIDGLDGALVLLVKRPGGDASEIPNGGTVMAAGTHAVIIIPAGDAGIVRIFAGKPEPQQ
jgi:trk system potassium uptake protein TrkA